MSQSAYGGIDFYVEVYIMTTPDCQSLHAVTILSAVDWVLFNGKIIGVLDELNIGP